MMRGAPNLDDLPMKPETSCFRCHLRALPAFASGCPEEVEFIQGMKTSERHFAAQSTVRRQGDSRGELFTLLRGWAFRYQMLADGRRQILNFLLPGDFVGLQGNLLEVERTGVEALTDVSVCVFPADALWPLFRAHPSLGFDVTWLCAHEKLMVDDNLVSVGRRSALERVAMLLIHLHKRARSLALADGDSVPFPLTQHHLADALGLSLVHTNRTLRRLQSMGMIRLERGRLTLGALASLQALADYHGRELENRPLI